MDELKTSARLISIGEMMSRGFDPRAEAVELLRDAADMVAAGDDGSASWRAVDAMMILKGMNKNTTLPGIDDRTGRGGRVDVIRRENG